MAVINHKFQNLRHRMTYYILQDIKHFGKGVHDRPFYLAAQSLYCIILKLWREHSEGLVS